MTSKATTVPVVKIGEARARLSRIVDEVGSDSSRSVVIGSRGKPTMICVSYMRFKPLLTRGNRAEKLAMLIAEELLPDAPEHIRLPAVAEMSILPMADLERLWEVDSLPLSAAARRQLLKELTSSEALERLEKRARLTQVLSDARDAGLYDALEHVASDVLGVTSE